MNEGSGDPHPATDATPARGNEQVLVKMPGKGLKHRMWIAVGIECQGQGVNGLRRRMQQEQDDIQSALLVFEDCVPTFKKVSSQKHRPQHRAYWGSSRGLRPVVSLIVFITCSLCLAGGVVPLTESNCLHYVWGVST